MGSFQKALTKSRQPLLVAWDRNTRFRDITVATYQDENGVRVISNRTDSPTSPIDGGSLVETASPIQILRAKDLNRLQLLSTCAHCEVDWRAPADVVQASLGQAFNCELCGGDLVVAASKSDDDNPGAGAGDSPPDDEGDDEDEDTDDSDEDDEDDDSDEDDSDDSDGDDSDPDSDDDSEEEDDDSDDSGDADATKKAAKSTTTASDEDDEEDGDEEEDETAADSDGDDDSEEDDDSDGDEGDDDVADMTFDDDENEQPAADKPAPDKKGGDVPDPDGEAQPEGNQPSSDGKADDSEAAKVETAMFQQGDQIKAKHPTSGELKDATYVSKSKKSNGSHLVRFKGEEKAQPVLEKNIIGGRGAPPGVKHKADGSTHEVKRQSKKQSGGGKGYKKHTVHSATMAEVVAGLKANSLAAINLSNRIVLLDGNDTVVARVIKDKCSPAISGMFTNPQTVVKALQAAAAVENATLEQFGLELASVEVQLDEVVQAEVASAVAGSLAETEAARRNAAALITQCHRTAMMGVAKGVWRDVENPIRDSLVASLQRVNVRNPEMLVDTALANSVEQHMVVVAAEAEKLAKKGNAARNEVAAYVGDAKYSAAETASSGTAADGVRFMNVAEPIGGANNQEVAAAKPVVGQKFAHLW